MRKIFKKRNSFWSLVTSLSILLIWKLECEWDISGFSDGILRSHINGIYPITDHISHMIPIISHPNPISQSYWNHIIIGIISLSQYTIPYHIPIPYHNHILRYDRLGYVIPMGYIMIYPNPISYGIPSHHGKSHGFFSLHLSFGTSVQFSPSPLHQLHHFRGRAAAEGGDQELVTFFRCLKCKTDFHTLEWLEIFMGLETMG